MSLKLLRNVLKIGKLLALTPSYEREYKETSFSQKLYTYLMTGFITLGVGISSIYRLPAYLESPVMPSTIQILLDLSLYLMNIYTTLTSTAKNYAWYRLSKNLKIVADNNNLNENSNVGHLVTINVLFWSSQMYLTYYGYSLIGVAFFKQLAIEYLQMFDELLINFLFYIVLKMMLTRYRALTKQLQKQLSLFNKYGPKLRRYPFTLTHKIKRDFCLLKASANIVNDIFGWPFLFTIIYASLQTLFYLQTLVVAISLGIDSILYILFIIFWHYIYVLVNIFLCEAVANEAKKMEKVAYGFEKYYLGENDNFHEHLQQFIVVVKDNIPSFTAARFFDIDRMTLFSTFNVVVTFLIVMVQFETARHSTCRESCLSSRITDNFSSSENETVNVPT